jgi:hypothetical protein
MKVSIRNQLKLAVRHHTKHLEQVEIETVPGSRMIKVVWPDDLDKAFDSTKHPRVPSGKGGGEFAPKGGAVAGAAAAAPAAKKPHYPATADVSTGGKESVARFKAKHYANAIRQMRDYGKDELAMDPSNFEQAYRDAIDIGASKDPEEGFKYMAGFVQRAADIEGKGAEFKAMREKLRVAGWRGAGGIKAKHVGAAAPAAAPAAKPAPKGFAVRPVGGAFGGASAPAAAGTGTSGLPDLSTTEVANIKADVATNAIRSMYLKAKAKIGKNDELFALQHKAGRDLTGIVYFHQQVRDILERNGRPGEMDEIDSIAQNAVNEFDDRVKAAREAKKPIPPAAPVPVKSVTLDDHERKAIAAPIWHKHIDSLAETAIAHGIRGGEVLRAWKQADAGSDPENDMLAFMNKLKAVGGDKMSAAAMNEHYLAAGNEWVAAQAKALEDKKAHGVLSGDAFHASILARVSPVHAKLLQMYHDNPVSLVDEIKGGGINDDTTFHMHVEGDADACMKGTSTSEGSRYGFPPSEVCAYEASVLAGFHVLQPTSYKEADDPVTGKKGTYSMQAWLETGIRGSDVLYHRGGVKDTPALRASVSEMIAFDYGLANRDRNPGNWMYDEATGEMRGVDNGLVGLEAGRGEPHAHILGRCASNCDTYCAALTGDRVNKVVKKEDVAKVKAFVNSPQFSQLVKEHYGQGVGAADLAKRHVTVDQFEKNWKEACDYGISQLEGMVR